MKRKKYLIGNWKMFKTPSQAEKDFSEIVTTLATHQSCDLAIAAPFVALPYLTERNRSSIGVFAQNAHWENEGAFTGEVSASMLASIHATGALVAHSERRQMFGETNQTAGKRVAALLKQNLEAVFCIGETLGERDSGQLAQVLRAQIFEAVAAGNLRYSTELVGSDPARPRLTVAYEPVWAIGTGRAASATEAQDAHVIVRSLIAEALGSEFAAQVRILYGGSVKPENIAGYMSLPDIDGALVGGASLTPTGFAQLARSM